MTAPQPGVVADAGACRPGSFNKLAWLARNLESRVSIKASVSFAIEAKRGSSANPSLRTVSR